jgi:hypothetical protein
VLVNAKAATTKKPTVVKVTDREAALGINR